MVNVFPTRESVVKALADLEKDCSVEADVAAKLQSSNCMGVVQEAGDCPLALWVTLKLTEAGFAGFHAYVGIFAVSIYRKPLTEAASADHAFGVDMSELLTEFRCSFDSGLFPELEKE